MSPRRKRLLTAGILMLVAQTAVEATVVSTAMPTIIADLGGLGRYSWVFTAYMLALTVTGPVWGKLSDLRGRRPVFLAALSLFLGGSMLCGQAHTMTQLILFRLLQGLGAGGLQPLTMTILGELYPLEQRAKVQSMVSGIFGVASVVGPGLGGWLTQHLSWRWVFYVNLPPGLGAGFLLGFFLVPHRAPPRPLDTKGAVLFTLSFAWLLLWLSQGWGVDGPWGWGSLLGVGLLLALLAWLESRLADPFLPLPLMSYRMFRAAMVILPLMGMCVFGCISYLPLYHQKVRGLDSIQAGLALSPLMLAWVVCSTAGPFMLLRFGYRLTVGLASLAFVGGYSLLAQIGPHTDPMMIAVASVLIGMGGGFTVGPMTIGVQSEVPREDLGMATSATSFMRSVGASVGIALMGAAINLHTQPLGHHVLAQPGGPEALALGLRLAFQLGLGLALAAAAGVALIPRGSARSLARH